MEMDFCTKGEVHITMLKHLDDAVKTFEEAQANSRGDNDKIIQNKISPNSFQF
jgi:hypothetical protein